MVIFEEPNGATPLDPDEMEGLKFKHITTRGELNELEQTNIESGIRWLAKQKTPDVLSEDFVRQLHVKLLGEVWEWAGAFRYTGKQIGVEGSQISTELRNLIEDAKVWVEDKTYEPRELALRFHHRLVWIHCFPNGNGRHSRIMADAILEKAFNQKPINWGRGKLEVGGDSRKRYINALRKADAHDFSDLMEYTGE